MQPSHRRLQRALEQFLRCVVSRVEGEAMAQVAELDLSFSQTRAVLLLAHADGPLPINEVARRLGLSVAATGRNVDELVRLGVLERQESPTDRRVKHVRLTDQGLALADEHHGTKRRALQAIVEELPTGLADDLTDALLPILGAARPGPVRDPRPTSTTARG